MQNFKNSIIISAIALVAFYSGFMCSENAHQQTYIPPFYVQKCNNFNQINPMELHLNEQLERPNELSLAYEELYKELNGNADNDLVLQQMHLKYALKMEILQRMMIIVEQEKNGNNSLSLEL